MPVLTGSPDAVDEFFGPFVRGVQLVFGSLATLLCVWLLPVLTWPLPAVLAIVVGQWVLSRRRVPICILHLEHDALRLHRGKDTPELVIRCDDILSIQQMYQNQGLNRSMSWWVVVAKNQELAFQLENEPIPQWEPTDIPLDFMTALFGGNPSVLRALAEPQHIVPQILRDRKGAGLAWLREHVPAPAWQHPSIRIWDGTAMAMDAHGLLDPEAAKRIQCQSDWVADTPVSMTLSFKAIADATDPIPHLNIHLPHAPTIAFPAPTMDTWWPADSAPVPAGKTTHLAEGVFLFWWVLRETQAGQLPEPIRAALLDVHRLIMPLPKSIIHHVSVPNQIP